MSDDHSEDEYEVGYGKPPKATRFLPGQSGNPKGRPKGAKNLTTDLMEELSELVPVREGDKLRRLPKQRALVKAAVAKAISGNMSAAKTIFELLLRQSADDHAGSDKQPLSRDERNVLDRYIDQATSSPSDKDNAD